MVRVEKYGKINLLFLCCSHDGELKLSRRVRCSVSLRASLGLSFDVGVAPLLAESLGSNLSGSSDHTTSRQGTSSMVLEKWVQYYRYCSPFNFDMRTYISYRRVIYTPYSQYILHSHNISASMQHTDSPSAHSRHARHTTKQICSTTRGSGMQYSLVFRNDPNLEVNDLIGIQQ